MPPRAGGTAGSPALSQTTRHDDDHSLTAAVADLLPHAISRGPKFDRVESLGQRLYFQQVGFPRWQISAPNHHARLISHYVNSEITKADLPSQHGAWRALDNNLTRRRPRSQHIDAPREVSVAKPANDTVHPPEPL
jgi:hypothetical protein